MRALLVLLMPAIAMAKPLPDGMKVTLAKGKVVATQQGATVTLVEGKRTVDKLVSADLSDDGKTLRMKVVWCMSEDPEDADLPLGEVVARIENAVGMGAHLKKKYPDAIAHFTIAAQKAPATPVYATNLLSAQSMAGKLDDADKTIATYAKANLPWWSWRLAVDSDLVKLRGRPSTKLYAGKRGTATSKKLAESIAYSPLGLVAAEVTINLWDGVPDGSSESELQIVDVATGKTLLKLPTETTCAMDMSTLGTDKPPKVADKACEKREAAKTTAKRKVADAVLADLGFEVGAKLVKLGDKKSIADKDGRTFNFDGDKVKLIAKGKTKDLDVMINPIFASAAFVPGGLAIVSRQRIMASCAEGMNTFELFATANP